MAYYMTVAVLHYYVSSKQLRIHSSCSWLDQLAEVSQLLSSAVIMTSYSTSTLKPSLKSGMCITFKPMVLSTDAWRPPSLVSA
jgi:hypothetical protein